jgi:hypothetical protein
MIPIKIRAVAPTSYGGYRVYYDDGYVRVHKDVDESGREPLDKRMAHAVQYVRDEVARGLANVDKAQKMEEYYNSL